MLATKSSATELHCAKKQRLCFVVPALELVKFSQMFLGLDRFWVFYSEAGRAQVVSSYQMRLRSREFAQTHVRLSQCGADRRLDERLILEAIIDLCRCSIQNRPKTQVTVGPIARVGLQ